MGYYRGDGGNYYRGDYYKGDPFLGGLIAGAAKKLLPKAAKWVAKGLGATGARTVGGGLARVAGGVATAGTIAAAARPIVRAASSPAIDLEINPMSALPGGQPLFTTRRTYRRMNPLNPRALRRAIRRAEGFEKFAKKTMSALVKPGGGRKFKRTTTRRK